MKLTTAPAAHPGTTLCLLVLAAVLAANGALAQASGATGEAEAAEALPPPITPDAVLTGAGGDTLRTNLQVAEALMGEALAAVLEELPPPPAVTVLVPGSTDDAATVMTNVATHELAAAGYTVHLEQAPAEAAAPVYEIRYRVQNLQLSYPESGRRFLFWKSWVGRKMDLAVQVTATDAEGQVLVSRRQAHAYQDRVPVEFMDAVESPSYDFTRAEAQSGGGSRRLEQVVVLGALAALVAVYFANTE